MSQVAPGTDQSIPRLPLLPKEPRRALQSQCGAQIPSLPSPRPSHGCRRLESPWLSVCFQDTTSVSSGQMPVPNTVLAAK